MIQIGSRSAEHRTNETPTTTASKQNSPVVLTTQYLSSAVGSAFLELQSVNCKEIFPELVPYIDGWKRSIIAVRKPTTLREK
ncbi:MAG: hypothetical protein GY820_22005 [Gammaproteobacteria bacterium]|nr:hypothetical protein [Gammaproteobacteria bacterium]